MAEGSQSRNVACLHLRILVDAEHDKSISRQGWRYDLS